MQVHNRKKCPSATMASLLLVALALCQPCDDVRADPTDLPVPAAPYAAIDRHALIALPEVEQTQDRLVEYLVKPAANDREKTRAIYRWMTDRIAYDMDALLTNHPGDVRADAVLRERKGTVFGKAALFESLARRAGLEAATIPGFVKGVTAPDEDRPFRPNHAWNAVKIDGRWQLLDATQGAGVIRGQRFRKMFQEQFFLPPPHHLMLTHFPVDPRWQLLPYPLTPQQWDNLPAIDLQLFSMGVTWEALCRQLQTPGFRSFVKMYAQHNAAKVMAVPLGGNLNPGWEYYFVIDSPQAAQIAFVQKDRLTLFRKNGTRFEGAIRPEPGELKVNVQRSPKDRATQTMFTYHVNDWQYSR